MVEGGTNFRRLGGTVGVAQRCLLCALPAIGAFYLLDLHLLLGFVILRQQYLALLLAITLGALFLTAPLGRFAARGSLPWYDGILSALGLLVGLYLVLFYPGLTYAMGELRPERIALGFVAIVLVVEATRRILGWVDGVSGRAVSPLCCFAELVPGPLRSKAISWERLFTRLSTRPLCF